MHTPSPEPSAELMIWVKGVCDLGHRASKTIHYLVVERTQLVFVACAIKPRWRLTQYSALDRGAPFRQLRGSTSIHLEFCFSGGRVILVA